MAPVTGICNLNTHREREREVTVIYNGVLAWISPAPPEKVVSYDCGGGGG